MSKLFARFLAATLIVGQAGNVWAQEPKAVKDQTISAGKPKLISNPPVLYLNLADADVKAVLETMGKKGGMNLVIDDSVTGKVSLSLKGVPLDEALNLVLKTKSLAARRLGSTLLIATEDVFKKKGFSGNATALLRFDNAKAEDAKKLFEETLVQKGKEGESGTKIVLDARTNALIIFAPEEVIDQAKALKSLLDIPTPQVEIEVKLIELSENAARRMGVNYGFGGSKFGAGFNNPQPDVTAGGPGNQAGNPSTEGSAITFTALGNFTANFNARLEAVVNDGSAQVIASPKVTTQDNKQATIRLVDRYPILQTTLAQNGQTTQNVTFQDIGQTLNITPRIDTQDHVTLELKPEISSQGSPVALSTGPVPVINTRSVDTTMRVRNGETIVIGGLKREDVLTSMRKIPLLGDIPLLGNFFRFTSTDRTKTDILLVVTPRLITKLRGSSDDLGIKGNQDASEDAPPKF